MEWFEGLTEWLKSVLGPLTQFPLSTIFVIFLAFAVSLLATGVQRLTLDVKVVRQQARELSKWRKELLKAQRSRDIKAIERLMKKKPYMDKLQAKYTLQTMKPAIIYIVPLFVLYWLFLGVFTEPVVYLPLIGRKVDFWIWYFITYSGFYPILQRVFNVDFQSSD